MTYLLTPRQDRLRILHERRARIDTEIRRLELAETDAEPELPTTASQRRLDARRQLIAWSRTPEFARRVATYGGASAGTADGEREAS